MTDIIDDIFLDKDYPLKHYILEGHNVVLFEGSFLKWAVWFEHCDRHVAITYYDPKTKQEYLTPIKCPNCAGTKGRYVKKDILKCDYCGSEFKLKAYTKRLITVSTVFLGLDHNHFGMLSGKKWKPLVFETMIFGMENDYQARYSTWDEAVKGHEKALQFVKNAYSTN